MTHNTPTIRVTLENGIRIQKPYDGLFGPIKMVCWFRGVNNIDDDNICGLKTKGTSSENSCSARSVTLTWLIYFNWGNKIAIRHGGLSTRLSEAWLFIAIFSQNSKMCIFPFALLGNGIYIYVSKGWGQVGSTPRCWAKFTTLIATNLRPPSQNLRHFTT